MSRISRIARKACVHEFMAMRIIPRTISFDDDIAVINSFLRHNGLGDAQYEEKEDNLIVTFKNGFSMIATAFNKEHVDEELIPAYEACSRPDAKVEMQDGYALFDNDQNVTEFNNVDDALEYLFGGGRTGSDGK